MSTARMDWTVLGRYRAEGPAEDVEVTLGYDQADPLAVTLAIPTTDGVTVIWPLSRDMVHSALYNPGVIHGVGDAKIMYLSTQRTVRIFLGPVDGLEGMLWLPAVSVRLFVRQSFRLCPPAAAQLAVDRALADLLGEGAAS